VGSFFFGGWRIEVARYIKDQIKSHEPFKVVILVRSALIGKKDEIIEPKTSFGTWLKPSQYSILSRDT
jgi:hypothetical protein